ncbi:hypothetical protein [Paenibacillus illinoisensis]|uniref:hypothetical protein n=1 Tax=Paenibacillus illinoisensis TaxID=59845 RepID=UPI00203AF03B|nr:hypothetical protein [Paenibacillus illinoisensis]MCM3206368.1 hypothetical protein [Paenibacillus illinoisensis]
MFNWFKKKNNIVVSDAYLEEEEQMEEKEVRFPELENKIFFKEKDRVRPFPEQYEDRDTGKIIYFQKDKYFQSIWEELNISGIGDKIERIEIVSDLDDAGECAVLNEDAKISITIRVRSFKMGINYGGYIHEYDEEKNREFCEVLAHELIHAKDSVDIHSKYGNEEYKSIREDKITNLAWIILGEYSACRKISERFNTFDTHEQIRISTAKKNITNKLTNGDGFFSPIVSLYHLNYAIATRAAHADVSEAESRYLETDNEDEKAFIDSMRKLFNTYYNLQPLNKVQYEELGTAMIIEFLTKILKISDASMASYIPAFQ